ncbi:DEKNAAC104307 [Brettanomyces naardenensis]|uniref:DEKNAAC104307 n=1 Tax=Brettanomyces naardenensis TaxID=13370 RepID=A0A448YQI7_BRENA|nr:DEKNAAC104307 [Brettanomyces naardenensis]
MLLLPLLTLLSVVSADWQFRSRPDLSPPQLNITIPATKDASPGYLFAAPFSGFPDNTQHGPRQAAPYIFTDKGELVWSGFGLFSIWATNFQAGRINGQDILFSFEGSHNPAYGHGHGHITILNNRYETIRELRAGNHKISDKHEFHIIDEKTGLIQIYQPVPADLSEFGASKEQQWIVDAIFQEIDLKTGQVLFEWSSLDHVSPSESVLPINPGQAGSGYNSSDAWDYFHINSVDKDQNGDYILSARDAAALYKIDGKTGDVIWKLGGIPGISSSSFREQNPFKFAFQHHARFLSTDGKKQTISFYDNSAHGSEDKGGNEIHIADLSSGKIVEVDTENWTAKLLNNYLPPYDILSKSQGSTQVLEDGNVLVNWGSQGAVTEYTHDGDVVFHAYFDSGRLGDKVENYRAFKFDWHGYPTEAIALFSEVTEKGETIVYVSWNGDTETKKWRFYSLNSDDERTLLGETERSGFETILRLSKVVKERIVAQAVGKSGEVLSTSDSVISEKQVVQYVEKENRYNLHNYPLRDQSPMQTGH